MSAVEHLFWQKKHEEARAMREVHRWSVGEQVNVGPRGEVVEIVRVWWEGTKAVYQTTAELRVLQAELIERTKERTDHRKQRHRDMRNAAPLAKVQPPTRNTQLSGQSLQTAFRPLSGSFAVLGGIAIPYASTGLRYVH